VRRVGAGYPASCFRRLVAFLSSGGTGFDRGPAEQGDSGTGFALWNELASVQKYYSVNCLCACSCIKFRRHCVMSKYFSFVKCVPPGVTFSNPTFCPHSVLMCFVWISEQTAIISLYSINRLVFITATECVYCAVRTGSLTIPLRPSGYCMHRPV
jgi:hypothetical protein